MASMKRAKIDFAPDSSFLDRFVGTYKNPLYGTIRIFVDAKQGAVLDAGEWTSSLGRKKEKDGLEKLVTTTAAWLGMELALKGPEGNVTLVLNDGEQTVLFEPVSDGK